MFKPNQIHSFYICLAVSSKLTPYLTYSGDVAQSVNTDILKDLGRAFVPTFKSPFICMVYILVCMFFQPRKEKFVIIKLFIIQECYSLLPFKYNLSNTNSRHKLLMSGQRCTKVS